MEYTINYKRDEHIMEVNCQGKILSKDAPGIISSVLQAAEESSCVRFLGDCREAELSLSTMDIFDVPKTVAREASARGLRVRSFKYAIVIKKGSQNFGFLETVF